MKARPIPATSFGISLALPLIVGPGHHPRSFAGGQSDAAAHYAAITGVLAANLVLVWITFLIAPALERILGGSASMS